MKIPTKGVPADTLWEEMESYAEGDLAWREGRAWGLIYNGGREPEAVAKRAFNRFMTENALDPTASPSLLRFEREVVAMARAHLGGDEQVVGTFTSGGTESILLAMKTARDYVRATRPECKRVQIVAPVTAHAAFHKAAHYFDMELVPVPVDPTTFRADPERMREAITDQTAILVASTPGYAHGVVDPVAAIGTIAGERNLLFHVDACIGGFLLPYFRRLGAAVPEFDFRVPGVTSISMDFHKYAYAPKGASVVMYRSKELRRHQIYCCAAWPGYTVVNPTVQSARSGGPLAAAWAVLRFIGDDGYEALARRILDATRELIAGIEEIDGIRVLSTPEMSILAVASDSVDVFHVCDGLKCRGWYVQPQLAFGTCPPSIHIQVSPGNVEHVGQLLADLRASVENAPPPPDAAVGASIAAMMADGDLDPETYQQILGVAGVSAGSLPGAMADVNGVLNALPTAARERLVTEFVNELFS